MADYHFSVDAALLQELGERLIGQPHIALAELIKNAYDADARNCRISFYENAIHVTDDGHGMTEREFERYWMRVGSTHKASQEISRDFGRPLTGAKGLGRLAVQFLAKKLTVLTTAKGHSETLSASINWTTALRRGDLQDVTVRTRQVDDLPNYPSNSAHGFRVVMEGLKHEWDQEDLRSLSREVWSLRSPFRRFGRNTASAKDFDVRVRSDVIEGARETFDALQERVLNDWKARITGKLRNGRSGRPAQITLEFRPGYGMDEGEKFRQAIALPIVEEDNKVDDDLEDDDTTPTLDDLDFDIRIYEPEGRQSSGAAVETVRDYLARFGNVNVYDRGFRLPYFGAKQDWLGIAAEHSRRLNVSPLLPRDISTSVRRYMLDLPTISRIFGVVELDTRHEKTAADQAEAEPDEFLTIQAGRDRLHDNKAFKQLQRLLRWSLHYYANRYRSRVVRQAEKSGSKETPSETQGRALAALDRYRDDLSKPVYQELRSHLKDSVRATKANEADYGARAALLGPLASAGMAALASNHEMARHRTSLSQIAKRLHELAKDRRIPELHELATEIEEINASQNALRRLFSPLANPEERSADQRLRVRPIAEAIAKAMQPLMPGVRFDFSEVPNTLRFPRGAYTEWSALLQNVYANAWNAMLDQRRLEIELHGSAKGRTEFLRISDTGRGLGVPIEDSGKFFDPFERGLEVAEAKRSIALGGQGLGLTIVRMIATQRQVKVRFIEPEEGYATTLELSWRSGS